MIAVTSLVLAIVWPGPVQPPPPAGIPMSGFLSQYGYEPTVATIAYRQDIGDLPLDMSRYDGVVAVSDCGLIGHEGRLTVDGRRYRIIIFDCAGDVDTVQWFHEDRIICEVGFMLAEKLEIVGRGGIRGRLVIDG